MTQEARLDDLLRALLEEAGRGDEPLPAGYAGRRRLLRGLMNLRPPEPIAPALLEAQDALLQSELAQAELTDAASLPPAGRDPRLALWRGDITRLRCGAIVNAANSALLGCFHPCHGCIDNAIHSAAGIQLRLACHALMQAQGHEEPPGRAKLTPGFNLPARYVLHTVGPIVDGPLTGVHRALLASCYRACLAEAEGAGVDSVAFCCISTGVYRFPRRAAAEIAVDTVLEALEGCRAVKQVVFNVFLEEDHEIYRDLLR